MKSEAKRKRGNHQQPPRAANEDLPLILGIAAFNTVSLVAVASGISPEDAFLKGLLALVAAAVFSWLALVIASPVEAPNLQKARPRAPELASLADETELATILREAEPAAEELFDIQGQAEPAEEALVGSRR